MTVTQLIAELPKLTAAERAELYNRLCELHERDAIEGFGPTEAERRALDKALDAYERDGNRGTPWREAMRQLREERDR